MVNFSEQINLMISVENLQKKAIKELIAEYLIENKFSMAVRFDKEKKTKKDFREFKKSLKNTIINREQFERLFLFKGKQAIVT